MNEGNLYDMMEMVKDGSISPEEAVRRIKTLETEDLGFARLDHHRAVRNGVPEVIYAEGKTVSQTTDLFVRLMRNNQTVMATRATLENYSDLAEKVPEIKYYKEARILAYEFERKIIKQDRFITVCSAGTSDIPVAEEAAVTAELLGNNVERIFDVGVAGIHRLFEHLDKLQKSNVIIVVAGMEGALAGVVAGLVDKPVVAVPASVGYGANFGGLSALLTMLNSCAGGIGVVNIDNGFGAAYLASSINNI